MAVGHSRYKIGGLQNTHSSTTKGRINLSGIHGSWLRKWRLTVKYFKQLSRLAKSIWSSEGGTYFWSFSPIPVSLRVRNERCECSKQHYSARVNIRVETFIVTFTSRFYRNDHSPSPVQLSALHHGDRGREKNHQISISSADQWTFPLRGSDFLSLRNLRLIEEHLKPRHVSIPFTDQW